MSPQRSTALVYVRVSRLDREDRERRRQEGDDAKLRALSPATQVAQCKALPAVRGMKVEVIEDLHRSGKTTKRPGLEQLRARLGDPDVAVVAVWSISRLGRSVVDLYTLLEEIRVAGVAFVSAKESIDTSTPTGRAFVGMLAIVAQLERELTAERVAANSENAARSGKMIGPVPFGYRRVDGEVLVDEPAAELVRLIFREYASGKHSYRGLADWLNEHGHRPPQGRPTNGRPPASVWVGDAVGDVLENVRYSGRLIYKPRRNRREQPIEGAFPAIVDMELWRACEAVRDGHRLRRAFVYRRTARYALSGLLRCHRCGGTVHGSARRHERRSYGYYVCRARYGGSSCDQPLVRVEDLEGQVGEWLGAIRLPHGFEDAFAAAVRGGRRVARNVPPSGDRRRALELRLARLKDLYEMGDVDRAEYEAKRAKVQAELAELEAVAQEPVVLASAKLTALTEDWDRMDASQRRRVLGTIFTDIEIEAGELVAATPRPGWLPYLERVCATRGRGAMNPRRANVTLRLVNGRLVRAA